MSGDASRVFIDTNVLVYAAVLRAPLHEQARRALQDLASSPSDLRISRQILREYAAVLTRSQEFTTPLSGTEVVSDVRRFEHQFKVADDNAAVTDRLMALLGSVTVHGRQVHDANIVATMQAYNVNRLLTNNPSDFARYSSIVEVIPLVSGN